MPELPEVETVRRVLEPHLLKKKITGVQIHNAQVIVSPLPEQFAESVTGQSIAAFERRGKFLRLLFDSGDYLTIHLRMTGCLTIELQTAPPEKPTHVMLSIDDGNQLSYEDVRRLGKLWFARSGEEDISGVIWVEQGQRLPQHPAFAGLRQGRRAMPRLRRHIAAHRPRRQEFNFLPALPEIMGEEDEISISDKAPFRIG